MYMWELCFNIFHHSPDFVNSKVYALKGVCLPGCFFYFNKVNYLSLKIIIW